MDIQKAIDYYCEICSLAEQKGYAISEYRQIDYGMQFSISTNVTTGLLRVFQNKKGILKVDSSQIKSEQILAFLTSISQKFLPPTEKVIVTETPSTELERQHSCPMIGTDESGKGDYFGPLVIAGVFLDPITEKKLADAGVRDSKKISDNRIFEYGKIIRSNLTTKQYSVVPIGPEKYNELYDKIGNLNKLLAWGHARAIENILSEVICDKAIADQFGDESFIQSALMNKGKKINLIQMPKAEQFTAVAAASVLARECFLAKLAELGKSTGIELPKGASQEVENIARIIIDKNGFNVLNKIAKLHFKTTKKLRQ